MKKYLKFNKCKAGHWVVMCGKQALACVYPKGQIFKKRMVFQEDIDMAEWTSECLYQLADFIASKEKGTRSTAHNKQRVKCVECGKKFVLTNQAVFYCENCCDVLV